MYDLVYLDDDNRECDVPEEDVRLLRDADDISSVFGRRTDPKASPGGGGKGEGSGNEEVGAKLGESVAKMGVTEGSDEEVRGLATWPERPIYQTS